MAKADVEAVRLLERFGVTEPKIDPADLAQKLGVIVVQQKMTADVSGMLLRRGEEKVIGVNDAHAPVRQRFTVAHELGHLVLHRGRPLILDTGTRVNFRDSVSSMATDREEMEANRFAAALLAPETMVRRAVREIQFTTAEGLVKELAQRFGVSATAMNYRLLNLGIISDPGDLAI
ncbi:ImmA/IrrE family metallo-endopeptidase [Streptomyces erythrochromogenes]|uniref:ImmA/IrrE family metallo-endopeptidase n=1 Tax=Streptomyces erythrochromogenes TaxID=285574 RepID=UPI00386F82E8|nr:ImmA/IrrE family metallo-endopeptidase [Streptomyces erythrochromogenes]WSR88283.1 ImmA/IrrE family metallo-endopeptidase [Streptomyces erythrochromogenes]